MARATLIAVALLLSALAPAALAAPAADADALIKRGVELRRQGRDLEALEQFRRAYEITPTPRGLAQIGLAEQALGRWVDAEGHITKALASESDPWIARNRGALDGSLATIAQHLGSLEILGAPAGAEILVAGAAAGQLPLPQPLRVPAGDAAVEVRAPGHVPARRSVTIMAGQLTRETMVLQRSPGSATMPPAQPDRPPAPPLPPPPPPPAGHSAVRTAAWVTLWAGAAALAVGGTGLVVREIDAHNYNNNCVNPSGMLNPGQQAQCDDWQSGGDTARTVAIGALVAAGALGVTSAILFWVDGRGRSAERSLSFGCGPQPGVSGLLCAGRF